MRGRHPDDDLLADLVADVLPADRARVVEAHVLGCEECAGLLADADRIRGLLVAGDPGPMPAAVLARIEAALSTAAAPPTRPRVVVAAAASPEAPAPWEDPGPPGVPGSRSRSGHRLAGVQRPRSGARRVAAGPHPRVRSTRPLDRPVTVALLAVAAVAVVAVTGAALLHRPLSRAAAAGAAALDRGRAGAASGEADSAGTAAAGAGVRHLSSGVRYTAAGLAEQARALETASGDTAQEAPGAEAPAEGTPDARPSPGGRARGTQRGGAPGSAPAGLSDPATLAGCLAALRVPAGRLVAVDLASYDGRDAAVLLLRGAAGGHEVFVVARTCSAAGAGALAHRALAG